MKLNFYLQMENLNVSIISTSVTHQWWTAYTNSEDVSHIKRLCSIRLHDLRMPDVLGTPRQWKSPFGNTCYVIHNFRVCSTSYVKELIDVWLNSIAFLGPHTQTSFCISRIVINHSCNLLKYNSKPAILVVPHISHMIFYDCNLYCYPEITNNRSKFCIFETSIKFHAHFHLKT